MISSYSVHLLWVWTTGTNSSCRNEVYFKLGCRIFPSTKARSMRCSCRAFSTSKEFPLNKDRETCGNFSIKRANNGGSTYWAIVVLAPKRSFPICSLRNRFISYSSRPYSSNIFSQCSSNSLPASVSDILFPIRSKRRVWYIVSNSWICFVMAGWLMKSSWDALVKLRFFATQLNTLNRKSDIVLLLLQLVGFYP